MITVIGMGCKTGDVTVDGIEAIKNADVVFARSAEGFVAEALSKLRSDAEFLGESCDAVSIVEKLQSFKMRKVAFCVVGDGYDDETVYLLEKPNVVAGVRLRSSVDGGTKTPDAISRDLKLRCRFDYYDCYDVLRVLRGENGCPWDKEQTHKSIVKNVIEEAYELANALENDDVPNIIEELGDLLMQVLFHLEIAEDNGEFHPSAVYTALCRKLIDRHPHVFGNVKAANSDESLDVWNAQKMKEHKIKGTAQNVLDVPRFMSALMRSQKIQSRASKGGYEFENVEQVKDKIFEELSEFLNADAETKSMEGGDLLFAVVNLLRLSGVDSETALLMSTEKFVSRVIECEKILSERGRNLKDLPQVEFDEIWAEAKRNVG